MITADQLVAHAVGDYVLQSDWMANEKTKRSAAALAHVVTYSLPFLLLGASWFAVAAIAASHFAIDRWRLARFVVWLKNGLAPGYIMGAGGEARRVWNYPWSLCSGTGYVSTRPPWLATWLLIIADNVMHVLCNGLALRYL